MNIRTLLNEEISTEFEKLKEVEIGTDEHEQSVDNLMKLVDRSIEFDKVGVERRKNTDSKRDKWIQSGIALAGIIIPVAVTVWGTKTTLRFEKEDVVTSSAGRQFINRLFRK